jgi:hypothetical protein
MSDCDGDLICLTDQQEIINGAYGGVPIHYSTKPTPSVDIVYKNLYQADMKSFNSKIGFITNTSTTMYAMLPLFVEGTKEYSELIFRLKLCRKLQGNQIDMTKGLEIKPFPKHWINWGKINDDMSEEEKAEIRFNNSLLIEKRPYFMRYLYPDYNRDYNNYNYNYDNYCNVTFGVGLDETIAKVEGDYENSSDKERELVSKYYKYNPLLDTKCTMNVICHYMEKSDELLKEGVNYKASPEIIRLLKAWDAPVEKEKIRLMQHLYEKYKGEKRNINNIKEENGERRFRTVEQFNKYIRQESLSISSNLEELSTLAVIISYESYPNDTKSFAWSIFGDGLLDNLRKNTGGECYAPFMDQHGDIDFLGEKYKQHKVIIEEDDWEKYLHEIDI